MTELHRFVDSRSESHDLTAMGSCADLRAIHAKFSCGHAGLSSPRLSLALLNTTEPCTHVLQGIDNRLFRWACTSLTETGVHELKCANWRKDLGNVSRQSLMERFPPPPVTVFGRKGAPRPPPDRFFGYGYFVQDRVGVEPTLHTVNNRAVLDPSAVVG